MPTLLFLALVTCVVIVASKAATPPNTTPPILFTETAQVLVLQFHFLTTSNTLSSFTNQLQTLSRTILPSNILLPSSIAWRIAAPNFRTNSTTTTKFPSLQDNVHAIRQIALLYDERNQTLRLVYYPDLGIGYTDEWATTPQQHQQVQRDPTVAVHTLMPNDLSSWNTALRSAAGQDGGQLVLFDELVFESQGAPIKPPAAMSPTVLALRANPKLKQVAVSLTPDFSVIGGKCKTNVRDSCSSVVRNPKYKMGTYYTQAYNVYTTQDPTLTDVTPWSSTSPGAACTTHKTKQACHGKCCKWFVFSKLSVCG